MSSYRQHLYHLVFRTKYNLDTIKQDHVNELYAYITGIIKHKNSHLYRINGIENHMHILTDMHPSIAPADFSSRTPQNSDLRRRISATPTLKELNIMLPEITFYQLCRLTIICY